MKSSDAVGFILANYSDERILHDLIEDAKEEGRAEAREARREKVIKEGIEIGVYRAKKAMVINLLDLLDNEVIAERLGMDIEEIKKIRRENS